MATATNRGRSINFISGINGVGAGSSGVINMPVNMRCHRLIFQCAAVNYTGGTALPITRLTGSGTGATITPTIVNGQVTGGVIVAGGSGWNVNDTFTFTDATGAGFIGTVATVTGGPPGAIATFTVTNGGTPTPISPATFFSALKLSVNGINMRDISAAQTLAIAQYCGYIPTLGELPIFFTQPWRNVNFHNEVNSWDLFGQSTFAIQFTVSSTVVNPQLQGCYEFDYFRNLKPVTTNGNTQQVPFLQPVAQHAFTLNLASGVNSINTLPFDYPISRIYIVGGTPGNISEVELYQDQNKVLETTVSQNHQAYLQYGFLANNAAMSSVPNGSLSGSPFDVAYISDPDQRYWKALKCANSMIIKLTSAIAQPVTFLMETLPGAYAS